MEEQGGNNLYGFIGNNPNSNSDLLGLNWNIQRHHALYAIATCDCGETWDNLARKIGMDTSDYNKWAKTTDRAPIEGKKYQIPNTIIIEYGQNIPFAYVVSIFRIIEQDAKQKWESKGFNVIEIDPTTPDLMANHLKLDSLYGMDYAGHGDEDGSGVLDPSPDTFLKPARYTLYGISFLNLRACNSLKPVFPRNGWRYNKWEFNVAKRGWVSGYKGSPRTFDEPWLWAVTHGKNQY